MLDTIIFMNGKKRSPKRRGKYKGMVGCKLADIGKTVTVVDKITRKYLGSFKLVRKTGETVVKHSLG